MPNVFVFGIGGTGSRVIRSLTMLCAAGVKLNNTHKIIPVIIDVDAKNADTSRALKALELYKEIRERGYGKSEAIPDGFFNANLNTLNSLAAESKDGSPDRIEDSFQMQFENLDRTFLKYIDPNEELAGDVNMDLLEALYDNTPAGHKKFSHTELNLNLSVGFKGNPNIGCVVFNNLSNTKGFKFVLNSIGEGDRIFIISSIFGGTGSSGFPQLVRLLQENEKIKSNIFGALTVMPYYSVSDDKKSAINSNRFNSKTEAALTYYSKYMSGRLNALYHIWDKPLKQYDNKEGGDEQLDPAHIVEFIGATSIIDFINKQDKDFSQKSSTTYYDFGIKKEDNTIDIKHFYDTTRESIMKPLTLFSYAKKIYLDKLPLFKNEAFYKELELNKNISTGKFYQDLESFFKEHYKKWLQEMTGNERQFKPFNVDGDLNEMVSSKPIKTSWLNKGISDSFLSTKLGKKEDDLKKTIHDSNERRFLLLLNSIAQDCLEKLEDLPTIA